MGRIGKDIEVSYTTGGTAIGKFSLATSTKYKGEEKTEWHRVVAWGKTAEIMAEYLSKGDPVLLEGEIRYGKYENKDGQTVYTTDINVNRFEFVPKAKSDARPPATEGDSDIPF
jgi:single-strand DNA-binding protein